MSLTQPKRPRLTAGAIRRRARVPVKQQWLSVMEVAREYNLSRQTIYDLCLKGRLPYYTVPSGRRRFRRDEIEPVLAPYRTPITDPTSAVKDPLGGLTGPVDAVPDRQ
jgi:excisionase family DNA binding protein